MNYRPYPDVDRALAQVERSRAPEPLLAFIDEVARLKLADFQRAWLNGRVTSMHPKRNGRSAVTAAIVDEAVKAGEHVHVAGRDGIRCAGGDTDCPLPSIGRGDQVVVEYSGHRARYEVTDTPFREQPGHLNITLRPLADDAEVIGE